MYGQAGTTTRCVAIADHLHIVQFSRFPPRPNLWCHVIQTFLPAAVQPYPRRGVHRTRQHHLGFKDRALHCQPVSARGLHVVTQKTWYLCFGCLGQLALIVHSTCGEPLGPTNRLQPRTKRKMWYRQTIKKNYEKPIFARLQRTRHEIKGLVEVGKTHSFTLAGCC